SAPSAPTMQPTGSSTSGGSPGATPLANAHWVASSATRPPRLAPALVPITDGLASGLRNSPCTSTPATASAMPARNAPPRRCARNVKNAPRRLESPRSPWPTASDSALAATAAATRATKTGPARARGWRRSAELVGILFDRRTLGRRGLVCRRRLAIAAAVVARRRRLGAGAESPRPHPAAALAGRDHRSRAQERRPLAAAHPHQRRARAL